jgi:hypothetical protein
MSRDCPAPETVAFDSINGHLAMRACDHQVVQQGFMVKVLNKEGFATPIPELIATFPADQITPACRQMTHDGWQVAKRASGRPSTGVVVMPGDLQTTCCGGAC